MQSFNPSGWPRPRGYSNGIAAEGRLVFVAGQIGCDAKMQVTTDDFGGQVRQALANIVAVLAAAGAGPQHIASMNWYVTDKREYLAAAATMGAAYREIIGTNYPVMTLVQVSALLDDRAKVEIEATAVVPHSG